MRTNQTNSTVIVVANRPRIFRELLCRALGDSSEHFEVVEVAAENELTRTLKGMNAQWLIVTTTDEQTLSSQTQSVLNGQPALSAIAVTPDGSQLEVLTAGENTRTRKLYQNISLAELVSVLSTAPHPVTP